MALEAINLRFKVDKRKVDFFKNYLSLDCDLHKTVIDSQINLKLVRKNWKEVNGSVGYLLKTLFKIKDPVTIDVYIFPEYFYLGASEFTKKLVLYGQPLRSVYFSSAIISHEVGHILLSQVPFERAPIVDEIICFLIEDYIYKTFEKINFNEVWLGHHLDNFHRAAYNFIVGNLDITIDKDFGERADICDLIRLIDHRLAPQLRALKTKKGLLSQLESS